MSRSSPLHIVRLDASLSDPPIFTAAFAPSHTLTNHAMTPFHDAALLVARLRDADVVITTIVPLSRAVLAALPRLKLVAVFASGTNHVDLRACEELGVPVCRTAGANTEAVAEHALGLYFAGRRRVVRMHELTSRGVEWPKKLGLRDDFGGCPLTAREEVVTIIGGGELGNRVASLARALNMTVQLAERKGIPASEVREGRTEFTSALQASTVIFLTLPYSETSKNTLSHAEFALMRPEAVLVNVARGGIVDEEALVQALEEKRIWGASTDVFLEEPASLQNSVLVRKANQWEQEGSELSGRLVLSPHLAWWGISSIQKLRSLVGSNIEAWARGEPENLVVYKP